MDDLLKFLAEQLGLAIEVVQQNAGEVIAAVFTDEGNG